MTEFSILRDGSYVVVTLDELIAHLIEQGWRDDEILDHLRPPTRPGLGLRAARELAMHVANLRGPLPPGLDPELVRAYRKCQTREPRPTQRDLADAMGFQSEDAIRDRLRAAGIDDYRSLHDVIAALPEPSA